MANIRLVVDSSYYMTAEMDESIQMGEDIEIVWSIDPGIEFYRVQLAYQNNRRKKEEYVTGDNSFVIKAPFNDLGFLGLQINFDSADGGRKSTNVVWANVHYSIIDGDAPEDILAELQALAFATVTFDNNTREMVFYNVAGLEVGRVTVDGIDVDAILARITKLEEEMIQARADITMANTAIQTNATGIETNKTNIETNAAAIQELSGTVSSDVTRLQELIDNIVATTYTKTEIDNIVSGLTFETSWQEPVQTYEDLATTYPEPESGWTVLVLQEGVVYNYNGMEWVRITAGGVLEYATETTDGIISSTNFNEWQAKPTQAQLQTVIDKTTPTQLTNEALDNMQGEAYWNRTYFAAADNTVTSKPTGVTRFFLTCLRTSDDATTQVLYSPLPPGVEFASEFRWYVRTYNGATSTWQEWSSDLQKVQTQLDRVRGVNITNAYVPIDRKESSFYINQVESGASGVPGGSWNTGVLITFGLSSVRGAQILFTNTGLNFIRTRINNSTGSWSRTDNIQISAQVAQLIDQMAAKKNNLYAYAYSAAVSGVRYYKLLELDVPENATATYYINFNVSTLGAFQETTTVFDFTVPHMGTAVLAVEFENGVQTNYKFEMISSTTDGAFTEQSVDLYYGYEDSKIIVFARTYYPQTGFRIDLLTDCYSSAGASLLDSIRTFVYNSGDEGTTDITVFGAYALSDKITFDKINIEGMGQRLDITEEVSKKVQGSATTNLDTLINADKAYSIENYTYTTSTTGAPTTNRGLCVTVYTNPGIVTQWAYEETGDIYTRTRNGDVTSEWEEIGGEKFEEIADLNEPYANEEVGVVINNFQATATNKPFSSSTHGGGFVVTQKSLQNEVYFAWVQWAFIQDGKQYRRIRNRTSTGVFQGAWIRTDIGSIPVATNRVNGLMTAAQVVALSEKVTISQITGMDTPFDSGTAYDLQLGVFYPSTASKPIPDHGGFALTNGFGTGTTGSYNKIQWAFVDNGQKYVRSRTNGVMSDWERIDIGAIPIANSTTAGLLNFTDYNEFKGKLSAYYTSDLNIPLRLSDTEYDLKVYYFNSLAANNPSGGNPGFVLTNGIGLSPTGKSNRVQWSFNSTGNIYFRTYFNNLVGNWIPLYNRRLDVLQTSNLNSIINSASINNVALHNYGIGIGSAPDLYAGMVFTNQNVGSSTVVQWCFNTESRIYTRKIVSGTAGEWQRFDAGDIPIVSSSVNGLMSSELYSDLLDIIVRVSSQSITANSNLDNFRGANYFGRYYVCPAGTAVSNKPAEVNGQFGLKIVNVGTSMTVQYLIADDRNSDSGVSIYVRSFYTTSNWTPWVNERNALETKINDLETRLAALENA